MYISLEGLIIPLFFPERSDNEIILPINLRPASQNWNAGLKNQMRGPDNTTNTLAWDICKMITVSQNNDFLPTISPKYQLIIGRLVWCTYVHTWAIHFFSFYPKGGMYIRRNLFHNVLVFQSKISVLQLFFKKMSWR